MPTAAELAQKIEADLGLGTPEYHEAMWFLFSILARRHYAMADNLRRENRRRDRAAQTREEKRRQALDDFTERERIGDQP